jgi:hypothetical protein
MKKRLAVASAALMFAGLGAGVVHAAPGPNGHNDHGLCTAYFNGQKNGHSKEGHSSPGPFAALEQKGDTQAIYDYCSGLEKGIGGNGDQNGRFTDCFDDSDNNPNTDSCTDGQSG